jgi:phosphoserine phosphatase
MKRLSWFLIGLLLPSALWAAEPLPSWNAGASRAAILSFVRRVTTPSSPDFVPEPDRIAVFDNDGTLFTEQPLYVQSRFALDRVAALAPSHPEWRHQFPFAQVLENRLDQLGKPGENAMIGVIALAHAGLTSEAFSGVVSDWMAHSRHPRFLRRYDRLTFVPMLELLDFLKAYRFTSFVVSGGLVDFMRPWAAPVYGIPPERFIGSTTGARLEGGVIRRLDTVVFNNDREEKPVAIQRYVGRRPIAAFGNSDADVPMLEWVTAGSGARLGMLVHHDDAVREYAYDRDSAMGRLSRGLDEAPRQHWVLISMKRDWKRVFSH